jgi:signal transduction histidine kinase
MVANGITDREKVFQTAAWMLLAYMACLAVIDSVIYLGRIDWPVIFYHLVNAAPVLAFLALAYSGLLKSRPNILAPLLILLVSAAPITTIYVFDLHLPPAPLSNIEGMVLRQLPALFIGLVLAAWHYNLTTILVYSIGTCLFEFILVMVLSRMDQERLNAIYFIIMIRTICLIVVGIFINQLVRRLRLQQESLKNANAQLAHYASTLESLTISRERNRMSRELHDTVVHTLSGLSVQIETAKAYWDVDPATAKNLVEQSLEATRSGLQETRRALKALRATPLDDLGFELALRKMLSSAAERGKVKINVQLPETAPALPPDVEQCLYRVAQEAVENTIRHANASLLTLKLTEEDNNVEMVIQDDGCGFSSGGEALPGHYGISGMRERSSLAGGILTIASKPGLGTTVRLTIKGTKQ